ncbi:phosphoglycerol transferase MdoB-like AlkP superfamily enzyme [Litorivivens lipolytica]|uniref:Phosphoglycerol transferase MdoB-like AlkP superfamily enzyme n=1 Tax=Litorivivens lipolytica TaxID=1524264 RepID=A0A7W4W2Z7_9GAMM|nr:LTA synthase family protein [Litorivivens lipolytica]MBB3046198.1 phosphoglycerol transferase MdoB-like AlkP superfamily enzyme [Litorivivens lipolytica]
MRLLQSRRLSLLLAVALLLFAVQLVFRLIFFFGFADFSDNEAATFGALAKAWGIGLRFDARLSILLTMPLLLLMVPRFHLLEKAWPQRIAVGYVLLVALLLTLFNVFDLGHYAYLGIRMDSTVVRFFDDIAISTSMIWESYPVVWITLGVIVLCMLVYRFGKGAISQIFSAPGEKLGKWAVTWRCFLVFMVAFWTSIGRLSDVPLRWNNAFFTGDPEIGALGLNSVLYFYETMDFSEARYDIAQVQAHYDTVAEYLGLSDSERNSERLNFLRRVEADKQAPFAGMERPPNIVFIMLESLGASRVSAYGNPLKTTPVLDDIADNGWFFEHFYVPVSGTAKTVWASITGLPDTSTVKTATRNPLIAHQRTIVNAFTDHEKYYFLGGSAGWANMRALIKASIDDLHLYEEGSYTEPRVDVWGISDLSLFREADKVLRDIPKEKPFFAIVQTAANHRPFTLPDDMGDFEPDRPDDETLYQAGFKSAEQYNAVRFLDYNVGEFFKMAKEGGYFDNTVFVFYGDHNNRITITPHMADFYEKLDLDGLHVPHMIYAPKLLPPKKVEDAVSLVDVLPTVAGLFGVPYEYAGLGRDYTKHPEGEERYVFTQTADKRHPVIGVISKDWMLRMQSSGDKAKLHKLYSEDSTADHSAANPGKAQHLQKLAKGLYESSHYLHYHNVEESAAGTGQ